MFKPPVSWPTGQVYLSTQWNIFLEVIAQFERSAKKTLTDCVAGLVDSGEDPLLCAARELKEETGYVGTPKFTSPGLYTSIDVLCLFCMPFSAH